MNLEAGMRVKVRPGVMLGVLAWSLVGATAEPVVSQSAPRWSLAAPDIEVGGVGAAADYELADLGGATLLPDGRLVVADRSEPFLKVFDQNGRFLRDIGRKGEGPGEYEYVYELDWCGPGELSVHDVDGRIHRYSATMEFRSTDLVLIDALGGRTAYNRDCHPNGFEVTTGWGDFMAQFEEGLYEATAPVVLLRGVDVVHDFGERLSSQRIGMVRDGQPTGSAPHPFGRATVVALGSERVYVGDGSGYDIEVYDLAGGPLAPLRWSGPSLRYDRDLLRRIADDEVARAAEGRRPALRRWYAEMPALDQLPAYDRILTSDTDEVWVRLFPRPGGAGQQWLVFGRDNGLAGVLELPVDATLWEVRGDRVVWSVLDDYDVPVVRVSRITKAP